MTIGDHFDLSREQIEQWSQQLGFDYVTDPPITIRYHYDRAWCRESAMGCYTNSLPKKCRMLVRAPVI